MTETKRTCYRDRDNGVYFGRNEHRHDCAEVDCRGCVPCAEDHCTAAKNCAWHTGEGELTCARCIGAVRRDLRWIADLASLMMTAAISDGVTSEAANLAGPSPHPGTVVSRRVLLRKRLATLGPFAAAAGIDETGYCVMPDDDWHHPYAVLGRWALMITEDYGHTLGEVTTATAASYLDRNLHRIANDDEQDFPLLGRELRKCRQHLESVLHNDNRPERGAPCRSCPSPAPRLRLEPGHWCDEPDCRREHYDDDTGDRWVCPRNRDHWWSQDDYRRWVYADAQDATMTH
ncbi:hypothetical protein [Nocardioides sp. YIM 152315]|uniref:hypothetical protein n=1 Tax=Nocardioides sp. YIM 152315 TaxID=3031760 RepID=UPI0023DCD31A|nr:hypothetical protein [Nocardioides sp. YIM 152315]MDF1603382.1 hypothetical protein [Nocardioides sp. YIM 152315]